ncbi:MAG: response regulator [Bryobacteraceae bacterium]|jgi:two-component system response regulator HydG
MKASPSQSPNILLIDDNRDGLIVRKLLLEEQGYHVVTASDGAEAFELYQPALFDVVVTDYRMPRLNGIELIGRIRERDPQARIVLLSGVVEPLGLTEENTGADAVIAKTSNEPAHLVRWVKRLLNRTPLRKPARSQKPTRYKRVASV